MAPRFTTRVPGNAAPKLQASVRTSSIAARARANVAPKLLKLQATAAGAWLPSRQDTAQHSVAPTRCGIEALSAFSALPQGFLHTLDAFAPFSASAAIIIEELLPLAAGSPGTPSPLQASVPVRSASAAAVMFSGTTWISPAETAAAELSSATAVDKQSDLSSAAPDSCSVCTAAAATAAVPAPAAPALTTSVPAEPAPAASTPFCITSCGLYVYDPSFVAFTSTQSTGPLVLAAPPLPPTTSYLASSAVHVYCPSSVAFCPTSRSSSRSASTRDTHNSVTIKSGTLVKDAAGAITKVLDRTFSTIVTALCNDDTASKLAVHTMVKSLEVANQYIKASQPEFTIVFLPFNRTSGHPASNCEALPNVAALPDPNLFAALVFKTILRVALIDDDNTVLNVNNTSHVNKMANAIISNVLDRGQAVMKLGGAKAMFIAMSAVINARHRLQRKHNVDIMLTAKWFDEDTVAKLGRVSKFLRINVLQCQVNGPLEHTVKPHAPAYV